MTAAARATIPELAQMIKTLTPLTLLALAGCTSTQPEKSFEDVRALVGERLGADVAWTREAPATVPAALPAQEVLTIQAATQFALSNNPRIQAFYEDIGIAEADFAAAGLLPNPVFSGLARFPDRAPHGSNIEFNVIGNLLDILMRPSRMRVSALTVDEMVLRVSSEILSFAAEVEKAYLLLQGALRKQRLREEIAAASEATLTRAEQFNKAGNLDALSVARERTIAQHARIERLHAALDVSERDAALRGLLGITDEQATPRIIDQMAVLPSRPYAERQSAPSALADRLDLAAARRAVDVLAATYDVTLDWRWLRVLEVGLSTERSPDRQGVIGPAIDIELPLFDRGQTDLVRTAAELRRQQYRVAALALDIVTEVVAARRRAAAYFEIARQYRDVLLPLHKDLTGIALQQYEQLLVGSVDVQTARNDTARVASEYIDAVTAYWIAEADLRRACGDGLRVADPGGGGGAR